MKASRYGKIERINQLFRRTVVSTTWITWRRGAGWRRRARRAWPGPSACPTSTPAKLTASSPTAGSGRLSTRLRWVLTSPLLLFVSHCWACVALEVWPIWPPILWWILKHAAFRMIFCVKQVIFRFLKRYSDKSRGARAGDSNTWNPDERQRCRPRGYDYF